MLGPPSFLNPSLALMFALFLMRPGPCPILHHSAFDLLSLGIAQDQTSLAMSLEGALMYKLKKKPTPILILLYSNADVLIPLNKICGLLHFSTI